MGPETPRRRLRDMKRKCPFCTREFSKAEHLERHIRSHTKERPFECPHCGRKYGRNDSLLRHIRDQHLSHTRSNKDRGSQVTSTWPTEVEKLSTTSAGDENEAPAQISQLNPTTSIMTDFNIVVPETFPDHDVRDDSTTAGESWLFTPTQDPLLGENVGTGVEDWLTYGDLDSCLHDWPFVLNNNTDIDLAATVVTSASSKPIVDLQRAWYTHVDVDDEQAVSGYATPVPRPSVVDDNYRQSLLHRLQIRAVDQSLPSVDFLNLCVRCYFKRFHPIFPVIHAATFRPSKRNAVLLLSICSIGSLLTGHPSAIHHGIQLFERLHKAILAHWETLMRRGSEEALATIQASLLGQTFGLLSGQPKNLTLVDAFHGTVVSWARREKIFQTQHSDRIDQRDLEHRWRQWVRTEEKIRLALGLRIHDAEIANILHHETLLPSFSQVSHTASDALFFASNPRDWMALYKESSASPVVATPHGSPGSTLSETLTQRVLSITGHSHFSVYAALQDVSSAIIEAKLNSSLTPAFINEIQHCLTATYKRRLHGSQFEPLRTSTKLLWHFLFISLHADLDLLERSIGRDGSDVETSDMVKVREWANSSSAKRCVAHAIMIKENLSCFPLSFEPAMHVPRVMFFSAICLFCYSKYGDHGNGANIHSNVNFPELQLLDSHALSSSLREAKSNSNSNSPTDVEMGVLYGLVDLLQRIGHWEISRKFASILGILLQAEPG